MASEDSSSSSCIEGRINRIWLDDDGILRVEHLPGAEVTLEDAQDNTRVGAELTQGRATPVLVDVRALGSITREARRHYAANPLTRAQALIVASATTRLMGNFFLTLSRPHYPTRLFTSEADALAWLREFLERPEDR